MTSAEQILDHALDLPVDQRALIAEKLIDSLGSESISEDVEGAWEIEIRRRMDDVKAGKSYGRSWTDIREELDRKLQAIRAR